MSKKQIILLRGLPLMVLSVALSTAFSIEVIRRGVPDLGLSVVVAVGFVAATFENGLRYLREPSADFSRNEAIARALLDLVFSVVIVMYALR